MTAIEHAPITAPRRDPLLAARAALELAKRRLRRAAIEAAAAGRTQREIADQLDLSQSRVNVILATSRDLPRVWQRTPEEIILSYAAGEIDHDTMLDELLAWPFTFDHFLDADSPMPEQYVRGDFSDVIAASLRGYLSDDDYAFLAERVEVPQA